MYESIVIWRDLVLLGSRSCWRINVWHLNVRDSFLVDFVLLAFPL